MHEEATETIHMSLLGKRKRPVSSHYYHPEESNGSAYDASDTDHTRQPKKKKKAIVEVPLIAVHPPPLAFPKSLYRGHVPPLPRSREQDVLREILTEQERQETDHHHLEEDAFIDAELEDFVIYRQHRSHDNNRQQKPFEYPRANELASLHEINENLIYLYFDGVIWYNGKKRYVERVPFETLSIGGYGEMDCPAVESDIWILSNRGKRLNTWYRLRTPAEEYRRFHKPFLWMAELAKNVVDYLSTHQDVFLDHFRADFYNWLEATYTSDDYVVLWLKQYGRRDFRGVLASQANFLWCQASQVNVCLEKHPIWKEIHPVFLSAIPEQKERGTKADMYVLSKEGMEMVTRRKTTVTPYVFNCFKHLPWQKFLYCQEPSVARIKGVGELPSLGSSAVRITAQSNIETPLTIASITVGDVVSLPQDTATAWKSHDNEWYGYVQSVTETSLGRQLRLLWLYRPSDTQCLRVPYPFPKELFLSDHCNCGDSPIYAEEVIRRPRVAFFAGPATEGIDHFVRQKYKESDGAWQTLQNSDFHCDCGVAKPEVCYSEGDTLLVHIRKALEPVVLVEGTADGVIGKIRIRRLLRRNRDYGDVEAEPNELVLTNRLEIVSTTTIHRECHVRLYSEEEKKQGKIPPPYNRQGTGDYFFITSQDLHDDESAPQPLAAPSLAQFKERWDPSTEVFQPLLKGLDIFCGGGNLGRGLEEGGAVKFNWAVDMYNEAIHTYKANLDTKDDTELFRGSVNDYLTQAMQGKGGRAVAQRGQVEMLAAGSPCQGYSLANPKRGNDRALFNCSLVASVVAFVDFYQPRYALMENVTGMARGPDTENMLALIISAFLGLGYQVRTFGLDAWNFGSPQSRSRVFISLAAPGATPLPEPPHTHSHPEGISSASLAKLANGLRASSRYTTPTSFDYVTAAEATKDIPPTDARTSCIPFPDHRMSMNVSILDRIRIGSVPRFPGGSTFLTSCEKGYMPQVQIDTYHWNNGMKTHKHAKCWQRVKRNALLPTVLTRPHPGDGGGGTILHWDEERILTIMEVRRGQGFLDEDVLIGSPSERWKIVGNSVARPVALALGLSLRKARANSTTSQKDASITNAGLFKSSTNDFKTLQTQSVSVVIDDASASSRLAAATAVLDNPKSGRVSCQGKGPPVASSAARPLVNPSTEKSLQSTFPAGSTGHRLNKTSQFDNVRETPIESRDADRKSANLAAEDGLPCQYERGAIHTAPVSKTRFSPVRGHQLLKDSNMKPTSLSTSPQSHFITRETTVSKITVETTTTILHQHIGSSPEL